MKQKLCAKFKWNNKKSRKLSLRNAYCLILKSKAKQVNKKKAQIEVKSSLLMFSETWDWS